MFVCIYNLYAKRYYLYTNCIKLRVPTRYKKEDFRAPYDSVNRYFLSWCIEPIRDGGAPQSQGLTC